MKVFLLLCIVLSVLETHSKSIPDTKKVSKFEEAARQFSANEELAHKHREKRGITVGNPQGEARHPKLSKKPRQTRETTKMVPENPYAETFAKVTKYGIKIEE